MTTSSAQNPGTSHNPPPLPSMTEPPFLQLVLGPVSEIPELVSEPLSNADLTAAVRKLASCRESDRLSTEGVLHTFSDKSAVVGRNATIALVAAILAVIIGGFSLLISGRVDGRIDTVNAKVEKVEKSKASAADFEVIKADLNGHKQFVGKRFDNLEGHKADITYVDDQVGRVLHGEVEKQQLAIENLQSDLSAKANVESAIQLKWRLGKTDRKVRRLGNKVRTLDEIIGDKFPDTKPGYQSR